MRVKHAFDVSSDPVEGVPGVTLPGQKSYPVSELEVVDEFPLVSQVPRRGQRG
jgi:hypothetical protein